MKTWHRHPTTGTVARDIRKHNRMYHRDKGRGGHRFRWDDLRACWISDDDLAILSHHEDRAWQLWWRHPEKGWMLQSWHAQLGEAKEEAENPRLPEEVKLPRKAGTYVVAEWEPPYHGRDPIMIRCRTEPIAIAMSGIFQRLGCHVDLKQVS